jgi:asparagine synthase (glutamine-hydrolysing)
VQRTIGGPDPEARLARRFERFSQLPWPSQMMRFDSETYLPEDVLTKVDRMSMAHSIESRVPLLDNDVIAFAAALPATMKIKNGRRKHVLKEVAAP